MNGESGPRKGRPDAAAKQLGTGYRPGPTIDVGRAGVLPWAAERIRAGRVEHGADLPRYGSPKWAALPAGSAARWGAVVLAAEAWRTDRLVALADLVAERLAGIADAERDADERWSVQARAIRRMANSPTYAELQRRRSVISGTGPGDYPGRAS